VVLRGLGLGGWMNMENFITGYAGSESQMRRALTRVLGPAAAAAYFDRLLEVFFTDEDAAYLGSLGVNSLRIPFNYRHFEDDDRPVTTVDDFEETLASVERGIDPDQDTPAAQMTVAAAIWLSTNPDQEHHHREHVLREASRLYFHGEPPADVAEWLREAGVG